MNNEEFIWQDAIDLDLSSPLNPHDKNSHATVPPKPAPCTKLLRSSALYKAAPFLREAAPFLLNETSSLYEVAPFLRSPRAIT